MCQARPMIHCKIFFRFQKKNDFHPYLGKIPNLTNIVQLGWNHQPVLCFFIATKRYLLPLRELFFFSIDELMIHVSKEEHVANKLFRYSHIEQHKKPCVFCSKRKVFFNGLLQSWAWGGVFDWTNWNKANVIDLYSTVFVDNIYNIYIYVYIYTLWLQTVRFSFSFNEESLSIWGSCEKHWTIYCSPWNAHLAIFKWTCSVNWHSTM